MPHKPYYYYGRRKCECLPEKDINYMGSGSALLNVYNKYGTGAFRKEILKLHSSFEEMMKHEEELVGTLFETDKWCLNCKSGGVGVELSTEMKQKISNSVKETFRERYSEIFTEERRKLISERGKGRVVSSETRQKQSRSVKGKTLGRIRPQEEKSKISNSMKGVRKPEGFGKKISEARKGMKFSEEHREKLSLRAKERGAGFKVGHCHSKETRQKLSESLKGKKLNISEEARQKMSDRFKGENNPNFGGLSNKHKERLSEASKNREKVQCSVCGGFFDIATINRWHNSNCKVKS